MSSLSPLSYLSHAVREFPDRVCLNISGKDYTFKEFEGSITPVRANMQQSGVTPGMKVALYADNDLFMLQAVFAVWQLGAAAVPMNIKYTSDKLQKIEENIRPDIGFSSPETKLGHIPSFSISELMPANVTGSQSALHPIKEDELALIMFTSGSTGVPKGVPITHRAIYSNTSLTAERLGISSTDKIFVNTPPYTTSSLVHVLTMFSRGASVVIERGFMFGNDLLDRILKMKCTGFGGVPVHFSRILAALEKDPGKERPKFLVNSGEHLPVPVINKIREKMPDTKIFCIYGLTEVAGRLCILDDKYLDTKTGSVGKPLDGMSVTIRNEEQEEVAPGTEGQVYVQGPLLTSGYINNDAVNKKEFTPYGFATGDYGYKDEDGFLFLKGRRDDIIKVGGEKVSLKMIEEVLYDFDDFHEFVVHPQYDEKLGNVPTLQYVMKEGRAFERPKLMSFLSKRLPSTHIPVKFEEVKLIERTTSGKTVRKKN